jgi:hypothetical protein
MQNFSFKNFPKIDLNKKLNILFLFGFLIAVFQVSIFFITDGNYFFLINDSYGYYFTEAKNIYRQGSIHDISKLILDLYYDQIREANYDFNQIKPYHFPIYSSYLSIFFHFSNNEFFIIALSQFFPCLIMLFFSHLILINYCSSKKSLTMIVVAFLCSPIVIFTCDSNAELFSGALIILSFYLGLFAKKREGFFYYLAYFLVSYLLFLRIKFLVAISILCLIYRILPTKYNEENKKIDQKNIIFFLIFAIILPSTISYYAYEYLNWHHLKLHDFKNLFSFNSDNLLITLSLIFNPNTWYLAIFLIFFTGSFFYCYEIRSIFLLKKISKISIINSCGFLFFISLITFYTPDGYRMLISFYPFILLSIYENFKKFKKINFPSKNLFMLKVFLILILTIFLYNNFSIIKFSHNHQRKMIEKTEILEKIMNQYNVKNVVINLNFFDKWFRLPFMHLLSPERYVFMAWKNNYRICNLLSEYDQDSFKFELLILPKNLSEKCDFIAKNYFTKTNPHKELNNNLIIYLKK